MNMVHTFLNDPRFVELRSRVALDRGNVSELQNTIRIHYPELYDAINEDRISPDVFVNMVVENGIMGAHVGDNNIMEEENPFQRCRLKILMVVQEMLRVGIRRIPGFQENHQHHQTIEIQLTDEDVEKIENVFIN